MIKLSSSGIKDWIVCSKRIYYRMNYSGEGEQNKELLLGSLIHKVIEEYWNDYDKGMAFTSKLILEFPSIDFKKFNKCIENFYLNFANFLDKDDEIEKEFSIKHGKDTYIVGRMDRISGGNVFDWKSTERSPTNIENDLQFIIYHDAYKELYKRIPTLFYAALVSGELIRFEYNQKYADILYNNIIPEMVSDIKSNNYYRKGILGYKACDRCIFKKICYKELAEE